jgi:hypothetical protein
VGAFSCSRLRMAWFSTVIFTRSFLRLSLFRLPTSKRSTLMHTMKWVMGAVRFTWIVKFGCRVLHDVRHLFEQDSIFPFDLCIFSYSNRWDIHYKFSSWDNNTYAPSLPPVEFSVLANHFGRVYAHRVGARLTWRCANYVCESLNHASAIYVRVACSMRVGLAS